eukprot:1159629-Pelagomonas_calceolata.AAC.2
MLKTYSVFCQIEHAHLQQGHVAFATCFKQATANSSRAGHLVPSRETPFPTALLHCNPLYSALPAAVSHAFQHWGLLPVRLVWQGLAPPDQTAVGPHRGTIQRGITMPAGHTGRPHRGILQC